MAVGYVCSKCGEATLSPHTPSNILNIWEGFLDDEPFDPEKLGPDRTLKKQYVCCFNCAGEEAGLPRYDK